ncbi:MAG: alpha-amylase family glycosyl hydrolase [Acidimicrobiia bacterium]
MVRTSNSTWWKHAVFYQIYPLSFADSNGDSYGDLNGIISHLDYLSGTLGIDAIWLSPFYKSPMKDWGYDVSDHTDVDPLFGDLEDAHRLIDGCHDRGLKVVVDYVINHTSDEHPWFVESKSSRDNPKRDWYVWRDGRGGGPPTNWISVFSGPAWTYDETTEQWYRHTYLSEQPDLNWRNPEVVEAMFDVARFWLDMGVDGFRVDAAHQIMKDPEERDDPPAPPDYARPYKDMGEYDSLIHLYDFGHPDAHEIHRQLRIVTDSADRDILTVGEIHIFDLPEWASYYGENFDQLHMPFNFQLMTAEWNVPSLRAVIEAVLWNVPVGGWTNWTLGNHDEIRMATRLPEGHVPLAALLLLSLRGSPFLYYGDELSMHQVAISEAKARDPWGESVEWLSRDGARTPMQWNADDNAGFSPPATVPWLPIGPGYGTVNVASELDDPDSILNLYRRLLRLRKEHSALHLGSFLTHPSSTDEVFAYRRESDTETMTVVLNFVEEPRSIEVGRGEIVFSTADRKRSGRCRSEVALAPLEGIVISH